MARELYNSRQYLTITSKSDTGQTHLRLISIYLYLLKFIFVDTILPVV